MPTHDYDEDEIDSDSDIDPEGPDPEEMDSSDAPDLDVCPHCRKMISEDAEQCPHCRQYLIAQDRPTSASKWIVVGTVLALVAALLVWAL